MTMDEVISLMAQLKGRVNTRTLNAAREIITLAQQYSFLGPDFTFDYDDDLDHQVNLLLVKLSDDIAEEMESRAIKTTEEDQREEALAWAWRPQDGEDPQWRLDRHCSDLKYALEGYVAVCFANGLTGGRLFAYLAAFLASPDTWPMLKEARQETARYKSTFVNEGLHRGRGVNTDPIKGMTLVAQTFVNETYQKATLLSYMEDATIIGYKVHRGSTYDCEECDELCRGIHPLDETVLPAHPRCCCYTTPVRVTDIL